MQIKSVKRVYAQKRMSDLKVGDKVLGPSDSHPKIIFIQENGLKKVYELKLSDSRVIETGLEHLNLVAFRKVNGEKMWEVVSTQWLLDHRNLTVEIPIQETFNFDFHYIPKVNEYGPNLSIFESIEREDGKVYLESIEYKRDEECRCLKLDSKEELYSCSGVLTHNTTLVNMMILYLTTLYGLMYKPYRFFDMAASTVYAFGFGAATQARSSQLNFEPILNVLEQAPAFERVKRIDDLADAKKNDPNSSKIYWTTASRSSVATFQNNLTFKQISDPGQMLGVTFLGITMTEISWWRDDAGWSDDQIYTFFSKAKGRVANRMKGNYFGRTVIDSSPYTLESPIDAYINGPAREIDTNYIVEGKSWEFYPSRYPNFYTKDGKEKHDFEDAFPLFKGNNKEPPKVIRSPTELQDFDNLDVIWCPKEEITNKGIVNYKDIALIKPVEFLRDYAGMPAGQPDRIFSDNHVIDDIFDNDLDNLYTGIVASANSEPENLIWPIVAKKFFRRSIDNKLQFYRNPGASRVVSCDQSLTGDATGISMSHVESDEKGNNVYVTDFVVMILPKEKNPVNLEAIKFFILDLIDKGGIVLKHVGFDQFQSDSTKQALRRKGIPVDYLSVDKNNSYYATFIDLCNNRRYKCGKNIFVKNNIKSIVYTQRDSGKSYKYDHLQGPITNFSENEDWDSSLIGTNAKDATDCIASNIGLLTKYADEFPPSSVWTPDYKAKVADIAAVNKSLEKLGLAI